MEIASLNLASSGRDRDQGSVGGSKSSEIPMTLTDEELYRITRGERVREDWPSPGATKDDVDVYVGRVATCLSRSPWLRVLFSDPGPSWIYTSLFGTIPDVSRDRPRPTEHRVEGLMVYVSRLAPYALYGRAVLFRGNPLKAYVHPEDEGKLPGQEQVWEEQAADIRRRLSAFEYEVLTKEELDVPLPFDAPCPDRWLRPPRRVGEVLFGVRGW